MAHAKGRKGVGGVGLAIACFFGLFDRLNGGQIVFLCLVFWSCMIYWAGGFAERGGPSIGEKIGRWIAIALFWGAVSFGIGMYFNNQRIDGEIQDAAEHLSTSYSTPSERVVGNLRFVVTNHGASPVNILTVGCEVRVMEFIGDLEPSIRSVYVGSVPMRLHPYGDSYSVACPSNSIQGIKLPTTWLVCGEVVFTVAYSIDEAPRKVQRPQFRYILYTNERDWTPTPLNEAISGCESTPQ